MEKELVERSAFLMPEEDDVEKFKKSCAADFSIGVNYYMMGSMPAIVDEQEFRRRVQVVFDRAWARGGGVKLVDRHGEPIHFIPQYAAKCARGVACSVMKDQAKAIKARAASLLSPSLSRVPNGVLPTLASLQPSLRALGRRRRSVSPAGSPAGDGLFPSFLLFQAEVGLA